MYPHVLPTCNYFPGGCPILQVAFYGNKCKNMGGSTLAISMTPAVRFRRGQNCNLHFWNAPLLAISLKGWWLYIYILYYIYIYIIYIIYYILYIIYNNIYIHYIYIYYIYIYYIIYILFVWWFQRPWKICSMLVNARADHHPISKVEHFSTCLKPAGE